MKRKTSGCSAVVTLLLITAVMAGLLAPVPLPRPSERRRSRRSPVSSSRGYSWEKR